VTLDERILAYLDGSCTPAEIAALEQSLDTDRAARDRFARLCEQDAALRQILTCEAPAPRRRAPVAAPQTPWTAIAVAAAAVIFAIILAAALSGGGETRAPKVARPRPTPTVISEPPPRPEPPQPPPPTAAPAPKKVEPRTEEPVLKPAPPPAPPVPPEPKPEPAPPPPPPAPPKATETIVVVARLEKVKGQVEVESARVVEGFELPPGKEVRTGADGGVTLRLSDASVVDLGPDTRVSQITNGTGKRVVLDTGTAVAQVTKQQPGQPLVFVTPHAEARVLGTKLTLTVGAGETRLEVREGRVKLTRLSDNASVDVTAGQYAVASDAIRPVAKKIAAPTPRIPLAEEFDTDARWQRIDGGFPTVVKGSVEIDVSPRPGDPYPSTWHVPGGLRTRQSFATPFRVTVDVDVSHTNDSINALLVLMPKTGGPRGEKNELAVRLRNGKYGLIVETKHVAEADGSGAPGVRERWTIDFGPKELLFSVNGKTVIRHPHGLTIAPEYFVELQGTAKPDAPAGARVRFDSVKIEQ
jgi:ferric-dicitrate binding protein FerR (iron transport regulator)